MWALTKSLTSPLCVASKSRVEVEMGEADAWAGKVVEEEKEEEGRE